MESYLEKKIAELKPEMEKSIDEGVSCTTSTIYAVVSEKHPEVIPVLSAYMQSERKLEFEINSDSNRRTPIFDKEQRIAIGKATIAKFGSWPKGDPIAMAEWIFETAKKLHAEI